MSDVTIPAETARRIAALLRGAYDDQPAGEAAGYADLLDPRLTLRDAVARALYDQIGGDSIRDDLDPADLLDDADAALAVVRDHIAALRVNAAEYANRGWADGFNQAIDDACRSLGADS